MQAIQTLYADHLFRSRLEARWAFFFDALDVHWQYEPEGFETPEGRYLPDFLLRATKRHPDIWVEIKPPVELDERSKRVVYEFALGMMRQSAEVGIVCLRGTPPGENAFMWHKSDQGERLGPIDPMSFAKMLHPDEDRIRQLAGAARQARF